MALSLAKGVPGKFSLLVLSRLALLTDISKEFMLI